MNFAIYWTGFITILLVLPEKTYSRNCPEPIDEMCLTGCYNSHGNCINCANCTKDQQIDIERYHPNECTSYPAFCREQPRNVDWREYATDFLPLHLPPLMGRFIGGYMHRWLLMFFQEDSHPTIGKLCMKEAQKIPTEWLTFQKARLHCTSQDGVMYSSLVAVKNLPYNDSLYLTLLSSSVDNKNQSALCLFKDTEIERVINNNTYYDPNYSNEWRATPSDEMPHGTYNMGVCSWGSRWTVEQKDFIGTHPLMFYNVTARQVLAEGDGLFTALATIQKKGRDGRKYEMVFIGTDDGRILKYALIALDTAPNFLEEIYFTQDPSVGISKLEIVGNPLKLKISTTDGEEPLFEPPQRCRDMEIQCVCEQDPFCTWNVDDGSCRSFDWHYNREKQARITKQFCEGIAPSSALLVTNKHGRPIITDPPTTTVDTKTTEPVIFGPTNGPDIGAKTSQSESDTFERYKPILILCAFVLSLCLLIASFVCYTVYSKRDVPPHNIFNPRDWISDWTSITFNQEVPYLKLKDTTEGGLEYTGKVVRNKTVFKDLKPLTQYEVCSSSEGSPFIVSTEGPSFSDWGTTVDTVEVKTDGCPDQYESSLVLECDRGNSHRMSIEEYMKFSRLTPNMKYMVWLEVCKKNSEKIITKCITDVTTKEESFRVEMDDGKPCLMWSNLPMGIERYIQSCRCGEFNNFLTDMDSLVSGSKELPPLPQHATFNLKVMTKIQGTDGGELEHILASVTYKTPVLDLAKLPEQSSPVQSSLSEDSSGLVMTTTQDDTLDSDDSSSRVNSLPVSEGDSEGSIEDSSSRIRSAPTLGSGIKADGALVARQVSEGNSDLTFIMANHTDVILNSQVNVNNGSSTSSGIGSLQSSQSSFVDLPYKGYGLQTGKECYQCSATLHSLTSSKLTSEVRHDLALKIFLIKEKVIPCLCELLNYSRDETAGLEELTKNPDDSLRPIREREVQSEQVFVVTLLYKLMEILIDLTPSSQMDRNKKLVKKMDFLYNVISFLATMTHANCPACKAILDSVNHLWICGGYEEVLKKDEIALSMR